MATEVRITVLAAVNPAPTIPPVLVTNIETVVNDFLAGKPAKDILAVQAHGFSQYGSVTAYMATVVHLVEV